MLSALAMRAGAVESLSGRKEALWYRKGAGAKGEVQCELCPRRCTIPVNESGFCRARRNYSGTLVSLGYGLPCSINVDPIEKKPFFNVHPATRSFSLACAGCNLRCKYCQNWEISQISPLESRNYLTPVSQLPAMALGQGCRSVAFTYTEPTTYFEYMLESAKAARAKGVLAVTHSNGFINPRPLAELCRHLDAANIDLKGFSEKFYREVVHASLGEVLETIVEYKRLGIWLELTTLIIPGHNDSDRELEQLARFIAEKVGVDTPWHVSQFYPTYRLTDQPRTPLATLRRARQIGLDTGLRHVYEGNVPGEGGENTRCPGCGEPLILRQGFHIRENRIRDGKCPSCRMVIDGVEMS